MSTPLWAPWRMPYIASSSQPEQAKATEGKKSCFLCEHPAAPAKFRENLVLVVQEHAFVCLNRYPFTPSHLLVAPRRHVADIADLPDPEYVAVMDLLRASAVRLRRAVSCQAMNIGFNLGAAAGAGVADHLHGHIVPRWNGDTSFMPVLADIRVMPEYLDDAWRRLYASFEDLPGARAAAPEAGG